MRSILPLRQLYEQSLLAVARRGEEKDAVQPYWAPEQCSRSTSTTSTT